MIRQWFTRARASFALLQNEKGEAVGWIVVILLSVILAVIAFKYLAPGIKGAAQNMSNALSGQ